MASRLHNISHGQEISQQTKWGEDYPAGKLSYVSVIVMSLAIIGELILSHHLATGMCTL